MDGRRQFLFALGAGALAAPFPSLAQGRVWRIGYLDFGSKQSTLESGRYAALMQGLNELGYVEGRNVVFEARYADGHTERLDGMAAELVRQKVDVILTLGSAASRSAQRSTGAIPVIVIASPDPVGEGFAVSLARPGGNVTGMSNGAGDTVQKQVELLGEMIPRLRRIAVLVNPANGSHASLVTLVESAAQRTGRQVVPMRVSTPEDISGRFAVMAREKADAVLVLADAFFFQQRKQMAALALKLRLPTIYASGGWAEAGGLMSYGADFNDNFRRAAIFVDKLLKGAKPGDLPFEQPLRYYFVINRKTAGALGIKLTGKLMLLADKVIE